MKRSLLRFAVTTAVLAPLAACDGGKKRDTVVVEPPISAPAPPPIAAGSLESIGATFAGLFRASSDSEPRDPAEGDLPPISFTAEPAEITGS